MIASSMGTVTRPHFAYNPHADVPDWAVLGRMREHLLAGLPIPTTLCPRDEIPDYIPALLDAGHNPTEIYRATGVRPDRYTTRSTR